MTVNTSLDIHETGYQPPVNIHNNTTYNNYLLIIPQLETVVGLFFHERPTFKFADCEF